MFEEDDDQEMLDDVAFTADESLDEVADKVQPKNLIPVKLNFILQQKVVTVSELEQICQGSVIACEPDAEKKVLVVANGVTIAHGELVSIEERLGVEITALDQEAVDDQR